MHLPSSGRHATPSMQWQVPWQDSQNLFFGQTETTLPRTNKITNYPK